MRTLPPHLLPLLLSQPCTFQDLEALEELERENLFDSLIASNNESASSSISISHRTTSFSLPPPLDCADGKLLDLASIARASSQGDIMKMLVQLEAEVRAAQIELQLSSQNIDDSVPTFELEDLEYFLPQSPRPGNTSGLPQTVNMNIKRMLMLSPQQM
jgi:hypothetical protein